MQEDTAATSVTTVIEPQVNGANPPARRLLNRQDILGAKDLVYEDVFVPEWEGLVRIRGLTGAERDAFEAAITIGKGRNKDINLLNIRAKLVAASCVNDDGARIFLDDDVINLGKRSALALNRVFEVAQRLSGLTQADVEELGKPSGSVPSDDSTSD